MDTPEFLYRFFKSKDHRDQFVNGHMRFRNLYHYREIEDVRADSTEGIVSGTYQANLQSIIINTADNSSRSVHRPGQMNFSGELLNPRYIMCTCGPEADLKRMAEKYGSFAVKIADVSAFHRTIDESFESEGKLGSIQMVQAIYDKDGELPMSSTQRLRDDYYVAHKHSQYSEDFEWRFVIVGSMENPISEVESGLVTFEVGLLTDVESLDL